MNLIPTTARWKIVWLLVLISAARSMDAVNFSVAAVKLVPEFGMTEHQLGILYSAYLLGYGLFHLPGGYLADVIGPRKLLGAALVWWSALTGLTAVAPQIPGLALLGPFGAFLVIRFAIGMAEGACYPGSTRMVTSWMTSSERGAASGMMMGGLGVGYAITPPIVSTLMFYYDWRLAFYAFSAMGLVLAYRWYTYATDEPEQSTRVSESELQEIRASSPRIDSKEQPTVPWGTLFRSGNAWLLAAASLCTGYGIFMYQAWFYWYLVNERGFSELNSGFFASGPFIAVAILSPVGGRISDYLVGRMGRAKGRRTAAIFGLVLSAVCSGIGAQSDQPYLAILLLSLADGLLYMAGASAIATVIDIGGPYPGVTFGFSNLSTVAGGVIASTATPMLAEQYGWEGAILAIAGITLVAVLLWLKIDADKPIFGSAAG